MWLAGAVVIALFAPGARVDGVGVRVERQRTLTGPASGVVVSGAVEVEILPAETDAVSVTISAEENLQAMVLTSTADGVLHIAVKGEPVSVEGILVRVRMPVPLSVTATGASRVSTPLRGSARAEVSGAARARLSGTPERLALIGRGAATIDAVDVAAAAATVEIAGASEVDVGPATDLSVTGSGVGRVRYRGDPRLRTNVSPTVKVTRFRP